MSKKQDDFYFQNFIECAGYSCQAAHLLKEILSDFKPEDTGCGWTSFIRSSMRPT